MNNLIDILSSASLAALVLTWLCYRPTYHFAHKHNIVDHPNKRKLQDHPIPVLGGIAVAVGMFVPLIYLSIHESNISIGYQLFVMAMMLLIGILDDIYDVPAWIRLVVEIFLIWFFLWATHSVINNFHGLFGQEELISVYTALPLSIIAGVGIINAINLIDGVDGYSSGFGILANILFAIVFYMADDKISTIFSMVAAAALIPFYIHNVFGNKSKMFIGDGGSLLIGMVMVCNIFTLLTDKTIGEGLETQGVGVVALALAIMCIPVFDTLRVMFARIANKRSPLWADKTHLHHRFIDLGFSHIGTSFLIINANLLIVIIWYMSYRLGCSNDVQFWIVVALGLLSTCGFYYGSQWAEKKQNKFYHTLLRMGKWSHIEKKGIWITLQNLLDRKYSNQ